MAEMILTPDEVTNVLAQIPATATGFLYVPQVRELEDGSLEPAGKGRLHVPDEWADAIAAADPKKRVVRRMVGKAEVLSLVQAGKKSRAFKQAIEADDDAALAWMSLADFPSDEGPVAVILMRLGIAIPPTPDTKAA